MNTTKRAFAALAGGALALLFAVGGAQAAQAVQENRDMIRAEVVTTDAQIGTAGVDTTFAETDTFAASAHGCPSGYVCIYSSQYDLDNGIVEHWYSAYGSHQLYDEYGYHYIYNNQTGGAGFTLCQGSFGTDCGGTPRDVGTYYLDLTPYNSIKLVP
ncbi:hypothetical protein [Myceligenerans crystallogenes]|uniref:Peptidase inhibitor family I36 n=1 Tax=Myceligenerans crystallogenes TaxID=316335 RepID=A0ABP4ZBX7_9MICO